MQFDQIYERTKYAFEHDEVFDLLMGENGYDYHAPMLPANIPTNHIDIFKHGIYPYYDSLDLKEKEVTLNKLVTILHSMMNSENSIEVWWSFSILFGQKQSETRYKRSPFYIADALLAEIKPNLLRVKNKLESCKLFEGVGYTNGLWGDVLRYCSLLNKHNNISVLG